VRPSRKIGRVAHSKWNKMMGVNTPIPKVLLELWSYISRTLLALCAKIAAIFALCFQKFPHSFIFRIPQVLHLPLICEFCIPDGSAGQKLPGVYQQFPIWLTHSACREGNSVRARYLITSLLPYFAFSPVTDHGTTGTTNAEGWALS
jgi:hypothetical protein